MPRQLLIVYPLLPIYIHFQPQLKMNRLVILLVVAVAMAMCSVSCEGNKNFFVCIFFNPHIIHEGKKKQNHYLEKLLILDFN